MSSLQCFITILYLDGKVVLSRQRPSLVPRKMSSSTETNLTEGSGVSWWKICVQLRISVAFLFYLVKLHRLWDLKGFHILHVLARLPLYSPPWRCEHNKAVLSHPWNKTYLERSWRDATCDFGAITEELVQISLPNLNIIFIFISIRRKIGFQYYHHQFYLTWM